MREALVADYPLTKVGVVIFKTDYNRITQPSVILAVRLHGIYADGANTQDAIVNTNFANGQVSQANGFAAESQWIVNRRGIQQHRGSYSATSRDSACTKTSRWEF